MNVIHATGGLYTAHDSGSQIDVRSVSRVGRSDVGTNAARIRDYLARVAGGD